MNRETRPHPTEGSKYPSASGLRWPEHCQPPLLLGTMLQEPLLSAADMPRPDGRGRTPSGSSRSQFPRGESSPEPTTAPLSPHSSTEYSGLNNHNIFEQKIPFHFNDPILQKNKRDQKG